MLSHVGKYEVKRLLGKGATGSVYLAIDPFGQREVAIKVLEKLSNDPEEARKQLRFFQNEAALAGKLRHPHIVSILDAGIEDVSAGDPLRYLVMEVVDGPPLTKHCDRSALLDPMVTAEIGYKCCKALEFANTLGVVHRDMKPANILTRGMASGELDIKVADFGAAQLARSDVTQVSGVGSPAWWWRHCELRTASHSSTSLKRAKNLRRREAAKRSASESSESPRSSCIRRASAAPKSSQVS